MAYYGTDIGPLLVTLIVKETEVARYEMWIIELRVQVRSVTRLEIGRSQHSELVH